MSTNPESSWSGGDLHLPESKRLKYKKSDTAIFEFDRGPNPYLNWDNEYTYVRIDRTVSPHNRHVSNHVFTLLKRNPSSGELSWLTPFMSNLDHANVVNNFTLSIWWEHATISQLCTPFCLAQSFTGDPNYGLQRPYRLVKFDTGTGERIAYDKSPFLGTAYDIRARRDPYIYPRSGGGAYIVANAYSQGIFSGAYMMAYNDNCEYEESDLLVANGFDLFLGYDSVSKKVYTHQNFTTKVYDRNLTLEDTWATANGFPAFVGAVLRVNKKIGIGRDPGTGRLSKWEYAIDGPMVYPAVPIDLGAWPFPGIESGYSTIYDTHSDRVAFWVPRTILEDVAFASGGVFYICDFDGGGGWYGEVTSEMVDPSGASSIVGGLGASQNLGDAVGFVGSGHFVTTANAVGGSFWVWPGGGGGDPVLVRWSPPISNNNVTGVGVDGFQLRGTVHTGTVDTRGDGGLYIHGSASMGPDYRFDSVERVNATGE